MNPYNNPSAAHAIHISNADKELLKSSETMVVHNPQSNMNNAVGRADIFALLDAGILTGLGTDGMSVSLFGFLWLRLDRR